MIQIKSIDYRGAEFLLSGIRDALIGVGGNGDAAMLVKDECRLHALEIAAQIPPKSLTAGKAKVKRDVSQFLYSPTYVNIPSEKSPGMMMWFQAGPNWLVGAERKDFMPLLSEQAARHAMRLERNSAPSRGKAWLDIGRHGRQHVYRLNRLLINAGVKASTIKTISDRIGRMKASFAETAQKLGGAIPGWMSKHLPSSKSIFRPELDGASPMITFGSSSRGVSKFKERVHRAGGIRVKKLRKRLQYIISGYVQDSHAGRRIRKHGP